MTQQIKQARELAQWMVQAHYSDHREYIVARAYLDLLDKEIDGGWQPIETAPPGVKVLLYCPDRGCQSNRERIEFDYANNGNGSYHSWATKWKPVTLPAKDE